MSSISLKTCSLLSSKTGCRAVHSVRSRKLSRQNESRMLKPSGARSYHTTSRVGVDASVHAFGRLIKAAVVEKQGKSKTGTKEKFLDSAGPEEREQAEYIEAKKREAARIIEQERAEIRSSIDLKQESFHEINLAKQRAALDARVSHANDPCFSERARAKAYELHKSNSDFWNAARLSNLFRVNLARMRISLWVSKMEEQAAAEGVDLDDTVERLLAEKYGELDFPGDIGDAPERIRFKNQRDTYFFLDDEVKSAELMKGLRNRGMVHYREAPRVPKRSIPPVKPVQPLMASRTTYKTEPGKFKNLFYMWDITPQKDIYTRQIVVRELDGSFRTGNWQDRRFCEDYRRFIKWPVKVPHIRPDENEPDHVPAYARVPEGYKVSFEKFD